MKFSVQPTNHNTWQVMKPAVTVELDDPESNEKVTLFATKKKSKLKGTTTKSAIMGSATFLDIACEKQGIYTLTAECGDDSCESLPFFANAVRATDRKQVDADVNKLKDDMIKEQKQEEEAREAALAKAKAAEEFALSQK